MWVKYWTLPSPKVPSLLSVSIRIFVQPPYPKIIIISLFLFIFWRMYSALGVPHWIVVQREQTASDRNGFRLAAIDHSCVNRTHVQRPERKEITIRHSNRCHHHQPIAIMSRGCQAMLKWRKMPPNPQPMWKKPHFHTHSAPTKRSKATRALCWAFCYQSLWWPALCCGCSMHIVIHTRKAVNF